MTDHITFNAMDDDSGQGFSAATDAAAIVGAAVALATYFRDTNGPKPPTGTKPS